MDQKDAQEFLRKSLVKKSLVNDSLAMRELLDELAYLPLAIRQAGAYFNMSKTLSIAKYLRLLRNTEQDFVSLMSKEFRDETRYRGSQNSVATTWVVSFSQIRERYKTAGGLLEFMSCIEWKAIPRSLLPRAQSEAQMEMAIGLLCGYSFLTRRENLSQDGFKNLDQWYDMHRLVHLAARVWVSKHKDITEVAGKALRHVSTLYSSLEHMLLVVTNAYIPHILLLVKKVLGPEFEKSIMTVLVETMLSVPVSSQKLWKKLDKKHQGRNDKLKEDYQVQLMYEEHFSLLITMRRFLEEIALSYCMRS